MKTTIIALALLASFGAHATKPTPEPKPPKTPAPAGSTATAGAAAAATGRFSNRVRTSAASSASIASGAVVASPAGGSVIGSGNGGGASVNVERSAPSVYAPGASIPGKSCRLTIGGGASKDSGAASGGVPIGNDQTCISGANFEFLDALKARGIAVSAEDYMRAACKVEGMADTSPCKRLAEQDAPRAQGEPATVAGLSNDPYIRARQLSASGGGN